MGFFNEVGRKVEKVKQSMADDGEDRDDGVEYVCRDCGTRHATAHDFCPDCGNDAVEPASTETRPDDEK
ncbi:hypothetical protein G9C85_16355 [Halorubellus sp. JP-L1]|uniref:hypothetical protein n=1 Tax=Halorubellus sp. JP-L1 TaxID=2715753 RepID=UPI001409437A|nr:hypothetical protein [Halorubellus sp. JP-L1]NHN43190.1 hypothetical protein [Halorubellus sp. JP-L1]